MEIHAIDALIVVVYMLAMVAFGVMIGRQQRNLSAYLLGGRDLPWYAILGSIVATETSTATFLSVPGISFAATGDMRFLQLSLGFIIGRVVVGLVLVPLYFRGEIFTAYEILDQRFGGASKRAASLLFLVTRNLGDGLRLFLAAIAMEKILGLPLPICVVLIGIATIIYTFFGGMKAVVWSDCIQFVIYMAGGLIALWLLIQSIPGHWRELVEFGQQTGRWRLIDLRITGDEEFSFWSEPYTLWAGLIGGAVLTIGTHGTDQMFVQRYLAAKSRRDACIAVVLSGFVVLVQFTVFLLLGVALACFYERVVPQSFTSKDEVFATYIVDHLPIGLVGLTLAAVFAAAMSTLSSSLNSSAAAAISDFYRPWKAKRANAEDAAELLRMSRWFTIAFGVLQILIGIGASYLSESVVTDALAIAGFTAGILLGVFGLGVLTKSAHQRGVFVGMVCGILILAWMKFGLGVAYTWLAVIGSVVTFSSGLLASWWIPRGQTNPVGDLPSEGSS